MSGSAKPVSRSQSLHGIELPRWVRYARVGLIRSDSTGFFTVDGGVGNDTSLVQAFRYAIERFVKTQAYPQRLVGGGYALELCCPSNAKFTPEGFEDFFSPLLNTWLFGSSPGESIRLFDFIPERLTDPLPVLMRYGPYPEEGVSPEEVKGLAERFLVLFKNFPTPASFDSANAPDGYFPEVAKKADPKPADKTPTPAAGTRAGSTERPTLLADMEVPGRLRPEVTLEVVQAAGNQLLAGLNSDDDQVREGTQQVIRMAAAALAAIIPSALNNLDKPTIGTDSSPLVVSGHTSAIDALVDLASRARSAKQDLRDKAESGTLDLSKHTLVQELQRLADPNQGGTLDQVKEVFARLEKLTFGSLAKNREVAALVRAVLDKFDVRLACCKEGCDVPAKLVVLSQSGTVGGSFTFDHGRSGTSRYHGGMSSIPLLIIK